MAQNGSTAMAMQVAVDDLHHDTEMPAGEAGFSLAKVHEVLQSLLPAGEVSIYEAGGGASSYLPVSVLRRSRVTVVDIDPTQVSNNGYAETVICGDVQTHRFTPRTFDLVTSYNVIEHLPDVGAAMERFAECLKPGGLLLIGAPHPRSLSGLVTKYSPHWFHVWFYRNIRGLERAGQPGEAPFPVYYHPLVLPARLKPFLDRLGLDPVYERVYESPRYAEMRARRPWLASIVDGITELANMAAARRINLRHGDYHLVLRKRAGEQPAAR
ncbi:class I SAM-dependent methyltransferase [Methylobacterium marchantiae]|uniref:Class I SAM-dependent methyltransferase n=1 Tax=Methylobacterium marchantiae TaxID=600331 RepID=A0ABW3WX85_9HYPH|nr:Ubiquinone biosynthesis O-methyltransferase, mitochondrial [Methylobacterium marchantiae]